jgi:hypothetical protein
VDCVWKDVHSCEQGIFDPKKDHFMADTGYSGTPCSKNWALSPK